MNVYVFPPKLSMANGTELNDRKRGRVREREGEVCEGEKSIETSLTPGQAGNLFGCTGTC